MWYTYIVWIILRQYWKGYMINASKNSVGKKDRGFELWKNANGSRSTMWNKSTGWDSVYTIE